MNSKAVRLPPLNINTKASVSMQYIPTKFSLLGW